MPLSVNPHCRTLTLNESPSEKEGKFSVRGCVWLRVRPTLNESPSEKEGKSAPPFFLHRHTYSLNESPSEKEGKACVKIMRR